MEDVKEILPNTEKNNPINLNDNNGTFATGIDYVGNKPENEVVLPPIKKQTPPPKTDSPALSENFVVVKSPTFFEVHPPQMEPGAPCLPIPVDIVKIIKNSLNSISKPKFNELLKNKALNELIVALISDSFWFIVCFFQSKNDNIPGQENDIKDSENSKIKNNSKNENYKEISQILRRMSCNYFKFFIRICDMGQTRMNDSALSAFKDFMSHSVYYSIYLAFPKSRHLFNEEFRNRIVSFFKYLYNGLISENNFVEMKWELDLGKGNIIENNIKNKDVVPMKLPNMGELQRLIERIMYKDKYHVRMQKKKKKRDDVNSDILNTPLYRIYAETNKFETLNLVKPIKMSNRKIIDIYQMNKIHSGYVKFAKETLKNAAERKAQCLKEIKEREEEVQKQINEIKGNEERVKRELQSIKIQRVQEYANYCIFLSK